MPGVSGVSKMETVKKGIIEAVEYLDQEDGYNDLLGLATFARSERVVVPLTKDRGFFKEAIEC